MIIAQFAISLALVHSNGEEASMRWRVSAPRIRPSPTHFSATLFLQWQLALDFRFRKFPEFGFPVISGKWPFFRGIERFSRASRNFATFAHAAQLTEELTRLGLIFRRCSVLSPGHSGSPNLSLRQKFNCVFGHSSVDLTSFGWILGMFWAGEISPLVWDVEMIFQVFSKYVWNFRRF